MDILQMLTGVLYVTQRENDIKQNKAKCRHSNGSIGQSNKNIALS